MTDKAPPLTSEPWPAWLEDLSPEERVGAITQAVADCHEDHGCGGSRREHRINPETEAPHLTSAEAEALLLRLLASSELRWQEKAIEAAQSAIAGMHKAASPSLAESQLAVAIPALLLFAGNEVMFSERDLADAPGALSAELAARAKYAAERLEEIRRLADEVPGQTAEAGHAYLSTACLHGEHGYCQSPTGASAGGQTWVKTPACCKFCTARCICGCHGDAAEPAPEPVPAGPKVTLSLLRSRVKAAIDGCCDPAEEPDEAVMAVVEPVIRDLWSMRDSRSETPVTHDLIGQGLDEADRGQTADLGSFARYADLPPQPALELLGTAMHLIGSAATGGADLTWRDREWYSSAAGFEFSYRSLAAGCAAAEAGEPAGIEPEPEPEPTTPRGRLANVEVKGFRDLGVVAVSEITLAGAPFLHAENRDGSAADFPASSVHFIAWLPPGSPWPEKPKAIAASAGTYGSASLADDEMRGDDAMNHAPDCGGAGCSGECVPF